MSPRTATRSSSHSRGSAKDSSAREQKRDTPRSKPRVSKPKSEPDARRSDEEPPVDDDAIPAIGENLRALRTERNLSLDALSQMSGVSRAMLGQIELNRSVPTITVLWRIAKALDIPFSSLIREPEQKGPAVLRRAAARYLTSADGTFRSRALFPADGQR
ncbi:MAG TPA: helix-turn-helix transcriptional regulator, partial [Polyangiaceae bacterium]|nr:helix-turn-helix transcriptional regulator [Polyangiaceae bacterium]